MRWIVVFFCFVSLKAMAGQWPASLSVLYQGKPVVLRLVETVSAQPIYSHTLLGNQGLRVGNRLLVRHQKQFNFNDRFDGQYETSIVFELEDRFWSMIVTAGAEDSLELLKQLQTTSGIELVEPDFLQVRLFRQPQDTVLPQTAGRPVREQLGVNQWPEKAGQAVNIAVIDAAFSLADAALQPINVKLHYDVDNRHPLPFEASTIAESGFDTMHGDANLATIWSKKAGYTGLAPDANAILLRRDRNWTSEILIALQLAFLSHADIVQAAWILPFTQQALSDALTFLNENGRNGKGTVIVAASGNRKHDLDQSFSLAAQPQVLAVNAESQGRSWPVVGRTIASQVPVPYQVYSNVTGEYSLTYSNTSAATAATTGVLAAVLSVDPLLSAQQLSQLVRQYSQPVLQAQSLMQRVQPHLQTPESN
ncbi:hypothetical protein KDD30_09975 [Photobacterium sp. GJ3]|uniref:S8 family serine peptidase n=1 Tax=Photobacterium sp. GJ3 TaxID=2829502 RepID=UPI001B8C6A02|nr:S8 family serine peptidase [Photobacterium sp. GJ3]QUJ66494.1 hypothetical protein KDD30_09975 [Photobacterium sp. GJ3]